MKGLLRALKRDQEAAPVEMLDAEALRARLGEPRVPKEPAAAADYVRSDARASRTERSWRRLVGGSR